MFSGCSGDPEAPEDLTADVAITLFSVCVFNARPFEIGLRGGHRFHQMMLYMIHFTYDAVYDTVCLPILKALVVGALGWQDEPLRRVPC